MIHRARFFRPPPSQPTIPKIANLHTSNADKMTAHKEYALLCLENPLLDIQAVGDEALLEKYGLKPNDAILAEAKHAGLYEDLLNNYDAKLIADGAAQNTARCAQYLTYEIRARLMIQMEPAMRLLEASSLVLWKASRWPGALTWDNGWPV
jgi:hypothetical protein